MDPVRYISNDSSGKQGYEIALALKRFGVETTLITGPTNLIFQKEIKIKKIVSADEMFEEVKNTLPVDIAICAAAVSDFRPIRKNKNKLKKSQRKMKSIEWKENIDILDFVSKNNKYRPKLVVGFSAETNDLNKNAILKLKNKNCDLIIANDVSKKDTGFNSDYNSVQIIDNSGKVQTLKKNKKSFIANKIVETVLKKFFVNDRNFN